MPEVAHLYRFDCRWRLDVEPGQVYSVLADVPAYPSWWPQVLSGREIEDGVGEVRVRSALPYELTLLLRRETEDPDRRVLRARIDGDLVGWSEWEVGSADAGSLVHFREEVRLGRAGLARLPALVRPILTANHDYMMRSGERGLRRHLSAG